MFKLHHCFLYVSLWIILATGGVLRGPPRILNRDLKPLQVVRLGQEFKASCPVEGDPTPIVDWYKDGEPIAPAWPRFRINNRSGLRIRPVYTEDSGIYECKGVNGFGSQIARIRLVVAESSGSEMESESSEPETMLRKRQDSSKVSVNSGPVFTPETLEQAGPMHLSSGNTIRFRCESTKESSTKVTWLKDGKPVGDKMWRWSTWTLILNKLTAEDSGVYTCVANNSMGKAEFSIKLHVTDLVEKQRPELLWGYPNNTSVLSGNEAVMECVVQAGHTAMPPHIKWLKRVPENQQGNPFIGKHNHRLLSVENQRLLVIQESDDDTIRINETQRNGSFVSKLIFARPEAEDEGIYICLATNNIGYTFKEARLTVLAGAEIMSSSSVIPFPLIVIGMTLIVAVVVIGAACSLRRSQDHLPKQTKSISPRQLSTPSINYSSSSVYRKQGFEQRQLLVSTSTHSSSSSSGGGGGGGVAGGGCGRNGVVGGGSGGAGKMVCQTKLVSKPSVAMTMSRCSCCADKSPEISALQTYDQCFNNSFVGSTSHSLHCGHWT